MVSVFVRMGAVVVASTFALSASASETDWNVDDEGSDVTSEVRDLNAVFPPDHGGSRDDSERQVGRWARVKKVCAKVEASDEQKTEIRDAAFAYKVAAAPLEATVKISKIKYVQNILASDGTAALATSAAADGIAAKTDLLEAKEALITKIFFEILKPEQRPAGLKCLMAIKLAKKASHGHRD